MPEDYYSTARDVVQGTRWYGEYLHSLGTYLSFSCFGTSFCVCFTECRNGHPYLVANVSPSKLQYTWRLYLYTMACCSVGGRLFTSAVLTVELSLEKDHMTATLESMTSDFN